MGRGVERGLGRYEEVVCERRLSLEHRSQVSDILYLPSRCGQGVWRGMKMV